MGEGHTARVFTYRPAAFRADLARALVGLAMCAGLLALSPTGGIAFWVIGTAGATFLVFAIQTALKGATALRFEEGTLIREARPGLPVPPPFLQHFQRRLPLESIVRLKVRFYGLKRGKDGILEVQLRAGGRNLSFDAGLEGFEDLLAEAVEAAIRAGLVLDKVTLDNLESLGFTMP